ncbi:anti-sigma factor family protein [Streptomyces apocyni]|uniref:anti-sigma factor family protein n=1 Tax=Streptomyces apocyni TaxID=2654677 RepID=UPI0012EACA27|nr:zf-HC2 domain-containing protein [Streptomyces apocyni]
MTTFGANDAFGASDVHETVGAYALGILDDMDARAFEGHLAGCQLCAAQLEELSGMEPMLAALADLPPQRTAPQVGEQLAARPAPRLIDNLVGEVAKKRVARRRRSFALAAAAAVLIIGGPLAVKATTGDSSGSGGSPTVASPAEDAFFNDMEEKARATDPETNVSATVGTEEKTWGTHAVLELKNVKGPLKCSLIAVGKNGEEETVTSWAVPKWGYGIQDSPNEWSRSPLYVHGGAAMNREDIDHFEVRTSDGRRLVDVKV